MYVYSVEISLLYSMKNAEHNTIAHNSMQCIQINMWISRFNSIPSKSQKTVEGEG